MQKKEIKYGLYYVEKYQVAIVAFNNLDKTVINIFGSTSKTTSDIESKIWICNFLRGFYPNIEPYFIYDTSLEIICKNQFIRWKSRKAH